MAKVKLSSDDTKDVTSRIRLAKKYAEDTWAARDEKWAAYYSGDHPTEFSGAAMTDHVVHNYVGRIVNLKVAGLAAQAPTLRFRPRRPDFETLARVWEVYMPYVYSEGQFHKHNKAALKDRYIFGRGWVSLDWKFETRKVLLEGERTDTDERVLYDNPTVRRVNPRKIFLDPGVDALCWEEAQFIVWEMEWPIDQFRKWAKSDARVNKDQANKVKGTDNIETYERMIRFSSRDEDKDNPAGKRAIVWRYHERDKNIVAYIAKEADDKPLMVIENPYDFEGYPFEPMFARPKPDKLDCVGDIENLHHWQRLFNLKRSKEATMIRTAKRFVQVPPDISEEDLQALESSADKSIVKAGANGLVAREVNTSGFPQEFIQFEGPMMRDFTEISGVTAMRRGGLEQGLDTATETAALVSQSSVGDRDEQADWEDFNRRVARKVKSLIEQFGDSERVAAVSPEVAQGIAPIPGMVDVAQGPKYVWVGFTPQQIADESEVEVLAGSMGAKEEAVERAQYLSAVQTVTQIAQAGQFLQSIGINPQETARFIFSKFGTNETERFFQKPVPLPPQMNSGSPQGAEETPNLENMLKGIMQGVGTPGSGNGFGGGQ